MSGRASCRIAPLVAGLLIHATAARAGTEPDWLKRAATAAIPPFGSGVPAIVLLDEQQDTVDDTGRVKSVIHHAIKLLTREGRFQARAQVFYTTDTGKVDDLHAWLIRPSGEVKRYLKPDVID